MSAKIIKDIPLINTRDLVIYPDLEQALYIGRPQTIASLQYAKTYGKKVLVLSQKRAEDNNPQKLGEMYRVGTICTLIGSVYFKDETMKAVLRGDTLFRVTSITKRDGITFASGEVIVSSSKGSGKIDELVRKKLLQLLIQAKPKVVLNSESLILSRLKKAPSVIEFAKILEATLNQPGAIAAQTAGIKFDSKKKPSPVNLRLMNKSVKNRQSILEEASPSKKLRFIEDYLKDEVRLWASFL